MNIPRQNLTKDPGVLGVSGPKRNGNPFVRTSVSYSGISTGDREVSQYRLPTVDSALEIPLQNIIRFLMIR